LCLACKEHLLELKLSVEKLRVRQTELQLEELHIEAKLTELTEEYTSKPCDVPQDKK